MAGDDPTQKPGETIGKVEGARLEIEDLAGSGSGKAVLFVTEDFDPLHADFEVIKVTPETANDMVRRRT